MKGSVLIGNSRSKVIDFPMPEISSTEVLIRVILCGVCTSEVDTWRTDNGSNRLLGHEVVGIIEDYGSQVTGFKKGDRVTGMIYRGYAEYTKADYRLLVKVPDSLDDCEALGEPLSCLISGLNRIDNLPCDKAAVIGVGYMGLGMIQLLKWKGVKQVMAIDLRPESLEAAMALGADIGRLPDRVEDEYKVVDWDQMDRGTQVVIEASGSEKGLELAGQMTAVHGTMAIAGFHQGGLRSVDVGLWNWKGITIINAHERRDSVHLESMRQGLALVDKGLFKMKPMVTHSFPLEDLDAAFRTILDKPKGFIKAIIAM